MCVCLCPCVDVEKDHGCVRVSVAGQRDTGDVRKLLKGLAARRFV